MMKKHTIDVIGAGVSGLSVAYHLNKLNKNLKIRLWEKNKQVGGLAGVFKIDNFCIEKFYHHIYRRDISVQNLVKEINVEGFVWKGSSIGSYFRNQPYRLSSPLDLLFFKPLSSLDRFRFGLLMLRSKLIKNWEALDEMTVSQFIRKTSGEKVYTVVWEPLLKGKFGKYAENISAAWLWCKLVDRGGRNKKGQEELGYLKGGFGVVFDKLINILEQDGHSINLNTSINRLESNSSGVISAIYAEKEKLETDYVVCCTQIPDTVNMLPNHFPEYKDSLKRIKFLSVVCLILVLNETLAEFYWNNIYDPDCPFIGVIEHTKWTGRKDYGNKHIVYISSYVEQEDPRMNMNAETLLKHYYPHIKKMFPKFNDSMIEKSFVWSAPYAQPIVEVGYRKIMPVTQSPYKNLYMCTMAQIYPHDRQVSNGVEMGECVAQELINNLENKS